MEILKKKIIEEGQAIGNDIVKVDFFLNHQIDINLLNEIGEKFAKRINKLLREKGLKKIDKILTVEASGIAVAFACAQALGVEEIVFAKKAAPNTMLGNSYTSEAKSFTKGTTSILRVSEEFLKKDENIFIVDDFLARGQAALALVEIVKKAGGNVVAVGSVIEKEYQGGSKLLKEQGIGVESLCIIEKIEEGNITFR